MKRAPSWRPAHPTAKGGNDEMNQPSGQNQLEALLRMTAQRMGTTPQALKQAAQRGDFSSILGGDTQESAALRKVLSDPEAAKKLLSTPQAQKLLQLLENQGKPS